MNGFERSDKSISLRSIEKRRQYHRFVCSLTFALKQVFNRPIFGELLTKYFANVSFFLFTWVFSFDLFNIESTVKKESEEQVE